MTYKYYNNSGWFDSEREAKEFTQIVDEGKEQEKLQAEADEAEWYSQQS